MLDYQLINIQGIPFIHCYLALSLSFCHLKCPNYITVSPFQECFKLLSLLTTSCNGFIISR